MTHQQPIGARTARRYSEFGKLLDSMARKRDARGPYAVAKAITKKTGYQVSGQAVSRCFYGSLSPRPAFIAAFAEAFSLSPEERDELAWLYSYGKFRGRSPTTP